jgi:lysophospholipid acyltransferase (LPLAT)-like uncharacterized protein
MQIKLSRISKKVLREDAGLVAARRSITFIAKTILSSCRLIVEGDERVVKACKGGLPPIYAFWHGKQLPLLAYRPHWTLVTLVSKSKDGELLAGILSDFGHEIVRGSSSRGGSEGYGALKDAMLEKGFAPCFAADGPRGPLHVIKPGAIRLASETGRPLIPSSALASRYTVAGSWDRLEIPWPGATIAMVFGDPIRFGSDLDDNELNAAVRSVSLAIDACTERAKRLITAT